MIANRKTALALHKKSLPMRAEPLSPERVKCD